MKIKIHSLALLALAGMLALPAYATDTCSSGTTITCSDGISYQLVKSATANPLVDNFTLNISGINSSSDTAYDGRSGVESFAFGNLDSPTIATPPTGFGLQNGGLNANGCSGSGSFFCFYALTPPSTSSPLAADSSLSYDFALTADDAADFLSWNPTFKIDWVGSQNNYDLVSTTLTPGPVAAPEIDPATATTALTLLAGGLAVLLGRRRKDETTAHPARLGIPPASRGGPGPRRPFA